MNKLPEPDTQVRGAGASRHPSTARSASTPTLCQAEGCSNIANFSAQFILATRGKGRFRFAAGSLNLCDQCLNPKGGRWEETKRRIAFKLWTGRGEMLKKLESFNGDDSQSVEHSGSGARVESSHEGAGGIVQQPASAASAPLVDGKSLAAGDE